MTKDKFQKAVDDAITNCIRNDCAFGSYAHKVTKAVWPLLEAAEKERDALRIELNEIRYDAAHQKALAESALRVAEGWEEKCNSLRAKIEAMERQEPVMWANSSNINSSRINRERGGCGDQHTCSETQTTYHDTQLYALPGAKGVNMKTLIKRLLLPGYDLEKERAIQEAILALRRLDAENKSLQAKIEAVEKQEPVAWAATDETCRIVEALSFNQSRRFDTPLGILPGAQPKPDCGEAGHDEGRCGNRQCIPGAQTQGEEK